MNMEVFDKNGKKTTQSVELADNVFGIKEINQQLIYDAIRNELANKRQGTAFTKDKSDVIGSNKKPWRQKGTGRARAGSRKSPIFKGGSVVFGPKPRDYSYKLPKKMKRSCYKNILSLKVQQERVKIVEDFKVESGKTKDGYKIMTALSAEQNRVVLIYKDEDVMFKRAMRNIPWVKALSYKRLSSHDLFYAKEILIMKSAAEEIKDFFETKTK
jgi:large subunit ribosomal protein L4